MNCGAKSLNMKGHSFSVFQHRPMTALSFFGRLLTAFGPSLMILFLYIGRSPIHVLLMLLSAFIQLISLSLTSLLWLGISGLNSSTSLIISSTIIQDVGRFGLFMLVGKALPSLLIMETNKSPLVGIHYAVACGFGMGTMSSLIHFINPLIFSTGPGMISCAACPNMDIFFIACTST